MACPFCTPEKTHHAIIHQTKNFKIIYNHKPVFPGHSMIIPNRHVETLLDLNNKETQELMPLMVKSVKAITKTYSGTGFDIALQNGADAGASVKHLHWHIVPRKKGDIDGDPTEWFLRLIYAEQKKDPISREEIIRNVKKIKKEFEKS